MRLLALALGLAMLAIPALAGFVSSPGSLMTEPSGTAAGAPPATVCLLASVGSKLLADTGSCLRVQ